MSLTNTEKSRLFRLAHPLSIIHTGMKQRCYNPNHVKYEYYGGRGIRVCDEWLGYGGSLRFEAWILENLGPRPEGMTIDRVDNDGNYEPGNLRWATWLEQNEPGHHRTRTTCTALRATQKLQALDAGVIP